MTFYFNWSACGLARQSFPQTGCNRKDFCAYRVRPTCRPAKIMEWKRGPQQAFFYNATFIMTIHRVC